MTGGKVISRLGPAYAGLVTVQGPACILATAIGIDVLKEFGIEARPLSVQVDVVNRAWLDGDVAAAWRLSAGYPPEEAAKMLAPRTNVPTSPWDGHLVIELVGRAALLDLDLKQMARPRHRIVVPPVGWFEGWNGTAGEWPLADGGRIFYRAKRDDVASWGGARDWWDRAKRADSVAAVVRAIRKGRP